MKVIISFKLTLFKALIFCQSVSQVRDNIIIYTTLIYTHESYKHTDRGLSCLPVPTTLEVIKCQLAATLLPAAICWPTLLSVEDV